MGAAVVERFKPSKPIQLGAMATHHILPADLEECPPTPEKFDLPRYIIGHFVDYDWQALGSPAEVKRIDTCALARAAWPDLDSHSRGALTYHLHPHGEARDLLRNAHSAETDIALCFRVFEAALLTIPMDRPIGSWGDVWRLSEYCRVPKRMTFGKHEGLPISEVPADYAEWYQRQEDTDPYLIIAFQKAGLLP
jgi:exodeoxyribonuclease X